MILRLIFNIIHDMGNLFIVSTPIGNIEDITIRALKILLTADCIACEDTRKTGLLIKLYKDKIKNNEIYIKDLKINEYSKIISFYDEIETYKVPEIIDLLLNGSDIALVSDAGTPLISDPGYKLISECIKKNIKIISIPGASSILPALVSSGLPVNQFLYLGYLPAGESQKLKILGNIKALAEIFKKPSPTIVFFETPHKLIKNLNLLRSFFGNIDIAVSRELTKINEEIWRGNIEDALKHFQKPLGEFVILFNTLPR